MRIRVLLLLVLTTSIMLSGCLSTTVLHPILKHDIARMKVDQAYTPEVDGWFISDLYLKEVAKAKVKTVVEE